MELKTVGHSKVMLEKELQEVIALTSQELEEYREKVLELEDEVGELLMVWRSGQAMPLRVQLWSRKKGPGASGPDCACPDHTAHLPDCTTHHPDHTAH